MINILIVDDEEEIMELMEVYLVNEGYNVIKRNTGLDIIDVIKEKNIKLVILDRMMPDIDGIQVCMNIRKCYNIPIIMVSAKSQDIDKIYGLSTGADDYITKPFNPMEFVARVKSQVRRYLYLSGEKVTTESENDVIDIKGVQINQSNHVVKVLGKVIKLTPKEYEILLLLARNKGRVFSSEEIFRQVWQEKYFDNNNTVMVHMWRIREKLEQNPKDPKIIETVWGVGYKIEE
ncbi:MAG: response regulator transcription factor [Clostridium sp.]|nr:response regulator transcription factor [Clostridium sp.]